MTKNNTVDTAQKGQTTIDKTPTGKVKTLKTAEERRKAREEQFRNFRINALRRRCKRMKYTEEQTEEFVKKLIEQMNAPNEYTIIVMLNKNDMKMMEESITNAGIKYTHRSPYDEKKPCGGYFAFQGTQETLKKIQEITPPGAKIHTYAKKMESVIPKQEREVIKKPSNNTAEKKAAAKVNKKIFRGNKGIKHRQAGRISIADIRRASRYVKKNLKKGEKIDVKKVFKVAEERQKGMGATTVQLKGKTRSTSSKKTSTNLKKAA